MSLKPNHITAWCIDTILYLFVHAVHSVPQMQEDPVYDFPEPVGELVGERRACPQRGSLKNISVLDRLLLTHPVWLQLSINSATALHILQREPPGVRRARNAHRTDADAQNTT